MSGRAFSLVEVDSIKTKFIISMNRIKKQPREFQSPLSSVMLQGLPLQAPFETVGTGLVVYFKTPRGLSYKKAVLSHTSRNRKCHILLEPFFPIKCY